MTRTVGTDLTTGGGVSIAGVASLYEVAVLPREVVAVLGCPVDPGGILRPEVRARCRRGLELWRESPSATLIPMGAAVTNDVVEARAMTAWFLQEGVPAERLLIDEFTPDTRSQAALIALLLRKGARSVRVACGVSQLPRTRMYLELLDIPSGWELHGASRRRGVVKRLKELAYETGCLAEFLTRDG